MRALEDESEARWLEILVKSDRTTDYIATISLLTVVWKLFLAICIWVIIPVREINMAMMKIALIRKGRSDFVISTLRYSAYCNSYLNSKHVL